MIQNFRKGLVFFLSRIDWGEMVIGFLMLLTGMAFNKHYGYRFAWSTYLYLCLWFFFLKASAACLVTVLSGEVYNRMSFGKNPKLNQAELRSLMVKSYWILSLALAATSFLPLIQIFNQIGFSALTLMILSMIYLAEFIFFIDTVQRQMAGMFEFCYALINAFFLPALCFSLAQNYLKPELIRVAFPLFIQLIAWRSANFLEERRRQKPIPSSSLIERLSTQNSLYILTALLVTGSLSLLLVWGFIGFWNILIILPIGFLAAWWVFCSLRMQNPNWERALVLIRLLPMITAVSMLAALWLY